MFGSMLGGRAYVIPADALPYLGRGLSLAVFELASLLRAESGGRLMAGQQQVPDFTLSASAR
jgi:hypothetical protein